jgi:hypothetical protein
MFSTTGRVWSRHRSLRPGVARQPSTRRRPCEIISSDARRLPWGSRCQQTHMRRKGSTAAFRHTLSRRWPPLTLWARPDQRRLQFTWKFTAALWGQAAGQPQQMPPLRRATLAAATPFRRLSAARDLRARRSLFPTFPTATRCRTTTTVIPLNACASTTNKLAFVAARRPTFECAERRHFEGVDQ